MTLNTPKSRLKETEDQLRAVQWQAEQTRLKLVLATAEVLTLRARLRELEDARG